MRLPFPLEVQQGADFTRNFDLFLSQTVPDDLSDAVGSASLTRRDNAAPPLLLTMDNGRVLITRLNRLTLLVAGADTAGLLLGDWWLSSTVLYPTGYLRPFVEGPVRVVSGVSS